MDLIPTLSNVKKSSLAIKTLTVIYPVIPINLHSLSIYSYGSQIILQMHPFAHFHIENFD